MKKKKTLIAASVLTSVFALAAAATHLEWAGYSYFDRDNGKNVFCTIDPKCRTLTQEEITLARKYFGDTINYKNVKIFDRPFMYLVGHNSTGMSPNGNIYFANRDDYRPNFSGDLDDGRKIMHELTHVAQYQSGMDIPKQAFLTLLKHAFNYEAAYQYQINSPYSYREMNLEQQAEVMEDYFAKRSDFEQKTTHNSGLNGTESTFRFAPLGNKWLKESCYELKQYEVKLSPAFPIQPDELCLPPAQQKRFKFGLKASNS